MRSSVLAIAGLAGASVAALGAVLASPAHPRQAEPPASFDALRTERLLENRIACRGCHVIAGRGGQIGPGLDGLGTRADEAYVRSVIRDPTVMIPGTLMPPQSVPEPDVERLVRYLSTLPPPTEAPTTGVVPEAPPALADEERERGEALYARHCAACHGPEGRGDGWNAPNLPVPPTPHADAGLMGDRTDDALYDAIYAGAFVLDGSPRMPPYGGLLAPDQIRALVAHIRTLCGCSQPAWAGAP